MTALTEVFVTVKPDIDRFSPEVKKKLSAIDTKAEGSKVAGRFGVGFNGAFGGIVKHSAGLFVGAFAAIKGAQFLGGFINDARESAKVARVSAQVIKSTGGVAGITAAQIGDLATAISNKTGADDEAIQSGENLLATFTNVRNETGKGNDVFNRATQAAVDMASAMNNGVVDANGLKAANIQLGKALNDPVKGVTALSKVGVSFTAKQKEQIKTLVDSGKTLEAQKIILGEVGKEFGGAAAAAADPLTRLQTIAGNLAEKVGGFLLPSVDKFATFVGDTAVPKISALSDVFAAKVTPKLQEFGGFVRDQVLPRLGELAGFFQDQILPRLKEFGGFVTGTVVPAAANLVAAFSPLAKDVGAAVVAAFEKLGPILQSIGQFIAGTIVPAVVDFTKWLKDNSTVVGAVAVGVGAMVVAFQGYQLALTVVAAATKAYAAVQAALNVVMSLNPIGVVVLALVGLAAGLVYAYKKSETFRNIVNGVWSAVSGAAVTAFNAVVGAVKTAIDWVSTNFPLVVGYITLPFQKVVEALGTAWGAIKTAAQSAIRFVVDKFLGLVQSVLDGAAKAFGWVPGLGDKLKGAATEFGKFRDSVNAKLSGIEDQTVAVTADLKSWGTPELLAAAHGRAAGGPGGPVNGPGTTTSDTAGLYALSRKEWVIKAASSMKYGDYAMRSVNDGTATIIPGFAGGGSPGVHLEPRLPSTKQQQTAASGVAGAVRSIGREMAPVMAKIMEKALGINPALNKVLSFVKSQVGKPYVWGGVGPGGYDCSGLVSAAVNVARGKSPYGRVGATGSMPWSGMVSGPGAFEIGWFQGNPGHTAATVNRVNIESAGGVGVRMGTGARGARDSLFTNRAHLKGFRDGGRVGDAPFDLLNPRGQRYLGKDVPQEIGSFASGAWKILRDQLAVVHRGEMVVPAHTAGSVREAIAGKLHQLHQSHVAHQAHAAHLNHLSTTGLTPSRLHPDDIRQLARALAGEIQANPPRILLDGRRVDTEFTRRALNGGY